MRINESTDRAFRRSSGIPIASAQRDSTSPTILLAISTVFSGSSVFKLTFVAASESCGAVGGKMIRTAIRVCVGVLLASALSQPAFASSIRLIGLSSSSPGTLYDVSPTTGAATKIVDVTGASTASIVGLASLDDTLYATDIFGAGSLRFGSINLATGAYTGISDQGGDANWWNLTNNDAADLFYVVGIDGTLRTVTPSGVISTIGATGHTFGGLAYDNAAGVLYGAGTDDRLYRLNTTTGASTLIGTLGVASANNVDIAIDPLTGTMYLNSLNTDSLYTVNTSTGLATLVGPNGATAGRGIDGLAFLTVDAAAVPEPATMLLMGSGLAIAIRRRRRS